MWTPSREIITPWPGIIVPDRTHLPRLPKVPWPAPYGLTPPTYRNSITPISGQSSATITVTKSTGTVDTDAMLVGILFARNGGNPESVTLTPPSGWALNRRTNNTGISLGLGVATYWKSASGEGASWDWTTNNQIDYVAMMISYSGAATPTFIDAENGQLNADGTNVIAPSVTTTVADTMLVGFFAAIRNTNATGAPTITAPGSMTQRQQLVFGGAFIWWMPTLVAEETQAAIGASGTRTATLSAASDTGNIGHLIAIAPLAGAAAKTPYQPWLLRAPVLAQ